MLQQSHVDKFLENCSDSDVKVIFEFLEAAKINSPESSELNSAINSL
jgi:predicted transcriptional regulator